MQEHVLEVSADFACFTRPEMKMERVSYDVITPSAARAVFEAILWRPAISWRVHRIEVLSPIRWANLRRNEVASKASTSNAQAAMNGGSGEVALYVEEDRQQRAALLLRDVKYRLFARFELTSRAGDGDSPGKFGEMFRRRASNGQCFNQPYLGCREFSCAFSLVEDPAGVQPIADSRDLGYMLYDLDFSAKPPRPQFFRARLASGVMAVPSPSSPEVLS